MPDWIWKLIWWCVGVLVLMATIISASLFVFTFAMVVKAFWRSLTN